MSQEIKPIIIASDKEPKEMDKPRDICHYLGCKCPGRLHFEVKVTNDDPNIDVRAQLFFCDYHFYVVSGNHFTCEKLEGSKFEIHGPFKEVELIEQVLAAKLMAEKIKEAREQKEKI